MLTHKTNPEWIRRQIRQIAGEPDRDLIRDWCQEADREVRAEFGPLTLPQHAVVVSHIVGRRSRAEPHGITDYDRAVALGEEGNWHELTQRLEPTTLVGWRAIRNGERHSAPACDRRRGGHRVGPFSAATGADHDAPAEGCTCGLYLSTDRDALIALAGEVGEVWRVESVGLVAASRYRFDPGLSARAESVRYLFKVR